MPLNRFGRYSLIIMQMEHRELFLFDPSERPPGNSELDCRWVDKFDIVWPRFRYAMVSAHNQCPKDWWNWDKYVMDKEMKDEERNT